MNQLLGGMRAVEMMLKVGFLTVLAAAAFQDYKDHRIGISVFVIFGMAGIVLRGMELSLELLILSGSWGIGDLWGFVLKRLAGFGAAVAVGGVLLLLSAVTGGKIGVGDGWFFVVSGLYLGLRKNLLLLAGGLLFCFFTCSVLMVRGILTHRDVRQLRIPFLPFLLPAGIGVMFL